MSAAVLAPNRDVETQLEYWKPVPGNAVVTDFSQPGAEKKFEELNRHKSRVPAKIVDIRGREKEFSLAINGFEYVQHDVPELSQASSEEDIEKILLPATEKLVQDLFGASKVVSFTHRIRSKSEDSNKRADNKAPALSIHSDFTAAGALHHLESVVKDATEREQLLRGRVYVINVWRPLKTITRDPLAVCDWKSVNAKQDWVANRFVFPHGWNELGGITYSPRHKWCYLNQQEPSEPLVFKQFDSKAVDEGGVTLAHTAFVDPEFADGPPRESMEIKMFVFVPEDKAE